jgi:hypothetical protein
VGGSRLRHHSGLGVDALMPPDGPPELTGRHTAHNVVDWLWDTLHISSGAFFFVLVSLLFTLAVYKINSNSINKATTVSNSVCHVVAQADQGVSATQSRLKSAAARDRAQAKDEDKIASVWVYARSKSHGNKVSIHLANRLIHAQRSLARQDRAAAHDLDSQLKAAVSITLAGC